MKCKVTRHNGVLHIDIDGKLYPPLSFKSFRPNPQNVSEFYHAGVRLFSVLTSGVTSALGVPYSLYGESWVGENTYDFSAIDRQMDMFIEHAPDAYFAPMLQLDTRDWYLKLHPEVPNTFTHLSQTACDETWKRQAADYMKAAIAHIEEKYGDRVYGYFLLCGTTTEWFSHFDCEEAHPIKSAGYKVWRNNEAAELPSLERLNKEGSVFLGEEEEDVYLARKFHNDLIADLILYFIKEAQTVIKHNKLLGLYYGYLFELGGKRLYNDGALGYEKVFLSPDLDMISSPSAYGYRGLADPSAFMVTQRTLDAHNKVYFLEFDHITHVAPEEITDGRDMNSDNGRLVKIPGYKNKCKNETESLNLMYRDFVLCQGNGAALWWFDMFDGWFRSEGMMAAASNMVKISQKLSALPKKSVAQVAVFAEGEAMYRARKSANLATVCLSDIRRTLAQCGAPYDLYSISDLLLPEMDSYQVYLFVNQYDIPEEIKAAVAEKCNRQGKTALWLYAPDYANGGKCDVANICRMTGIGVRQQETSHGALNYGEASADYGLAQPYFCVEDKDAQPLAYFEDGTVAAAKKGSNIYVATCNLPSGLLRDILDAAGVFIYSYSQQVYTYTNSAMIGVYNASGADAQLHIPGQGEYQDLLTGEVFNCQAGKLILPKRDLNAYLLIRRENHG